MRIGLAQIRCSVGDIAANCAKFWSYAQRAAEQGCQVLLFPELSDTGYATAVARQKACAWTELPLRTLQECAARYNLYIASGLTERTEEGIYNALAVVSPTGALVARYRKTHLFPPAPCCEDQVFRPGASLTTLPIGEFVWAFSICYDLRFPELYRALALRGVEVFATTAAWPAARSSHWEILTQARAIENQAYMLAVNHVGTEADLTFGGGSCIVDPMGQAVRLGAEEEGLLVGEIDKEPIRALRASVPILRDRRPELYLDLSSRPGS